MSNFFTQPIASLSGKNILVAVAAYFLGMFIGGYVHTLGVIFQGLFIPPVDYGSIRLDQPQVVAESFSIFFIIAFADFVRLFVTTSLMRKFSTGFLIYAVIAYAAFGLLSENLSLSHGTPTWFKILDVVAIVVAVLVGFLFKNTENPGKIASVPS